MLKDVVVIEMIKAVLRPNISPTLAEIGASKYCSEEIISDPIAIVTSEPITNKNPVIRTTVSRLLAYITERRVTFPVD